MSKIIFYSWQSDLEGKNNNFFIRDCIKKALKQINREAEAEVELSLDKDTQNTSGSPDIVDTIMRKIRGCDIFICDVSIVNQKNWIQKYCNRRKMPNPNVLIELGYAVKTLGWERVICVMNTATGRTEDLPFDIRNNRVSIYSLSKSADRKKVEKQLIDTFAVALKSILDNYDSILEEFNKDDNLTHDKLLFKKFDSIASQVQIFESIDFLVNNLRTNDAHYRIWRNIASFNESLDTNFLNEEIQESFETMAANVSKIHYQAALRMFSVETPGQIYATDYTDQGVEITPEIQFQIDQTQRYAYPNGPRDNDWNTFNERMYKYQDDIAEISAQIKDAYSAFRLTVKRKLFL